MDVLHKKEINTDNDRRLAAWIAKGGRTRAAEFAPAMPTARRVRAIKYARRKLLEEVARLTDELQSLGVE